MKCLSSILLLIFSCAFANVHAQVFTKRDSLELVLKSSTGKERVDVLNKLVRMYVDMDVNKALVHAENAYKLADELGYDEGENLALNRLSIVYWCKEDFPKAMEYSFKAIKFADSTKNYAQRAKAYLNLGTVYSRQEDADKAIECYQEALKYPSEDMWVIYNNLCIAYSHKGEYEKSNEVAMRMKSELEKQGDHESLGTLYGLMGNNYIQLNKPTEALKNLHISLYTGQMLENSRHIGHALNSLCIAHLIAQHPDSALYYGIKGYEYAQKSGLKDLMRYSAYNMSKVYENGKQFKDALFYDKIYNSYQDSLNNKEIIKQMLYIESKYKSMVDSIVESDTTIRNSIPKPTGGLVRDNKFLLIGLGIGLGLFFFFLWYRRRQKKNEDTADSTTQASADTDQEIANNLSNKEELTTARHFEPNTVSSETKIEQPELDPEEELLYSSLLQKLDVHMLEKKPFTNPSLSLEDLASSIDVPSKQLSSALNRKLGMNFYDYINNYRVEQMKIELLNPANSELKISAIAFSCGFNSKSAYNAVFKKITGLTPSDYKKNQDNS